MHEVRFYGFWFESKIFNKCHKRLDRVNQKFLIASKAALVRKNELLDTSLHIEFR